MEWKGIKGADGRCYMLDLVRLTPKDPNWMEGEKGTGVWATVKYVRLRTAGAGKGGTHPPTQPWHERVGKM